MIVSIANIDGIEYNKLNYVTFTLWICYISCCNDCGWLIT